jgi:hypothetical protein
LDGAAECGRHRNGHGKVKHSTGGICMPPGLEVWGAPGMEVPDAPRCGATPVFRSRFEYVVAAVCVGHDGWSHPTPEGQSHEPAPHSLIRLRKSVGDAYLPTAGAPITTLLSAGASQHIDAGRAIRIAPSSVAGATGGQVWGYGPPPVRSRDAVGPGLCPAGVTKRPPPAS